MTRARTPEPEDRVFEEDRAASLFDDLETDAEDLEDEAAWDDALRHDDLEDEHPRDDEPDEE